MDDIEQVEYVKLSPKKEERVDLDIEDIKYRVKGKREVLTERGENIEKLKTDITTSQPYRYAEKAGAKGGEATRQLATQVRAEAPKAASGASMALTKYLEWRKAQQAKRAAVQSPQVQVVYRNKKNPIPKKRIVYVQGGAQLQPIQPQGSGIPDISGNMKPPDITGGASGYRPPNIMGDQKLPSIIGDSAVSGGILNSSQPSKSTFDNMIGEKPSGSTFDKLGFGGGGGGILGSLGIKKKGGFW